ncbi:hypothetical protein AGABI1DRAFT_126377 [Agaricus bisporus var. burnettii JB137-S8]|uniref:NACHT domain-containing protein n=1 Tax=Agaricus bisporus var. burnettii (strain JB137-S8 / ATCC MYA-4627 / FGSC 10392) TaxID=597362 RepID=K5XFL8_AGABU|nr:uncharacterized protein AGABI1DRAFT_126377 [Agaricus bisporus var. burnettii JB137-S8]EKM82027.1 hypothetical protein AGABI1DRAFT_126377 [Agaricus bisporus var. burnettii JB137-S8]
MPKLTLHLPGFMHFGRSRSPKPKRDSSSAIDISPSSHSSSPVGASQQVQGGSITAAQNISDGSAGQLTHDSQPVISLIKPYTTGLQLPSPFPQPTPPPRQHLPQSQNENPGALNVIQNTYESRNVSVEGNMNQVSYNYANLIVNASNKFMAELLEKTIPGAAFDSSARDPPPRCHPGTRLAILARCIEFIANAVGEKKMRWVVGAAGVGKSAIMQNVAESPLPSVSKRVSIFFSINGRNDGIKAIITIAYQLAAKCEPYRQFIEHEITREPSLLQSSVSVQFEKFVVEPMIRRPLLNPLDRVLIIIDGLDECDKSHTQRELLRLISDACSTYPSSPIVWMIASRPEPHITSFFTQDRVKAVYEKEEILVDSYEARSDAEKFLRNELTKIQNEFSLHPRWLPERDLWKLANASGGLFVFADTVIKYIGDPVYGNPTAQLNDVLKVIDVHPLRNVSQEKNPMARLDALYAQILSKVPGEIMINTRKILLALILASRKGRRLRIASFLVLCNWLGMTSDDAYAATRHLLSVLDVPERDKAHKSMIRCFHKSFIDYISDSTRSGFSSNIEHEAYELEFHCTFRIFKEAPSGINLNARSMDYTIHDSNVSEIGELARGPGTGDNISLTWSVDEEIDWTDNGTRLIMYKLAISNVVEGVREGDPAFCTEFCIRLLTTRWRRYNRNQFPFRELQKLVFESFFFYSSHGCDAETMH